MLDTLDWDKIPDIWKPQWYRLRSCVSSSPCFFSWSLTQGMACSPFPSSSPAHPAAFLLIWSCSRPLGSTQVWGDGAAVWQPLVLGREQSSAASSHSSQASSFSVCGNRLTWLLSNRLLQRCPCSIQLVHLQASIQAVTWPQHCPN